MILDRFKLTDKVALVTGGGKGIGRGIAWAFAEAGAEVAITARTQADLDETARGIQERGRRALTVQADVTKTEDLGRIVDATLDAFGRIDILVNNVGGSGPRAALETSEAFFEAALRINVTQAFLLTKLVVPIMIQTAGGGAIVNISSRSSDMVQTSFVAYGAGKAALNMMTRNMAPEFAPKVRINALSVGGVATEGLQVVLTNEALRTQFNENTPMGRPGTVEDIAAAALFLASPAAGWITGKVFQVDGGTEAPAMSVPVDKL